MKIVAAFQRRYPEIHYDVYWESRTANAQAFTWDRRRCVRLYGGFARNRKVTVASLAWALAHETGHHLGGPPFHELQPQLSSEERADIWAKQGLIDVFGRRLAKRYMTVGQRWAKAICH